MNLDRTRSAIEEEFSLEEQSFQSVIDMETEDDYSRGNQVLYSSVILNNAGPTDNFVLAAGNYFIEAIVIEVGYATVSFGPGTAQLQVLISILGTVSGTTFLSYVFESLAFFVGGGTTVQTIVINQPFNIDCEVLIPRGDGINCHVVCQATGASVTASTVVFGINIYGRKVP